MKHFIILFFMLFSVGVINLYAQVGCQLPGSNCTEAWTEQPLATVHNVYLPSNNGLPCTIDVVVRYERRCNEIRIKWIDSYRTSDGNPPPCYDISIDAALFGVPEGGVINRAISGLLSQLFDSENKTNWVDLQCPNYTKTYSASYASCFSETWTITWFTANPAGGPPVLHTHDMEIQKTPRYEGSYGLYTGYTTYFQGQVLAYLASQGVAPSAANVTAKYIPCQDYCCIIEYSFCYDGNMEVEQTLTHFYPSNRNCPELDEQCYIQTCQ